MSIIDLFILIFLISALFRGREIGFVQQLSSTLGFFVGLFIGALLEPHTVRLAHTALARAIITLCTTLGFALVLLIAGEYAGMAAKRRVLMSQKVNKVDNFMGAGISGVSLLLAVWLSAAIIASLPVAGIRANLDRSSIISALNQHLPAAPMIIADLGHLIDPNGFPQVFRGLEPAPPENIELPSSSKLVAAVQKDKASVVKITGQGCGGIVEGSGFVVGSNFVATNAHVVAGIDRPYVQDAHGTHTAVVVWFDPNLDFAVLRVSNLAGSPLVINPNDVPSKTEAAVLGYPGGGGFTAGPAAVLDQFTASGRNIYDRGDTERDVYELAADIIPGNSGGPLVATDGSVIGVIFAQSTTYKHVGYALTTSAVVHEIDQAEARNQSVSSGTCAE